jgi:c(7)-type cytochrome triheme protein
MIVFAEHAILASRLTALRLGTETENARNESGTEKAIRSNPDSSKFNHGDYSHSRLPCLLCHRRVSNALQPTLPGHTPCAGCHSKDFVNSASAICTVCHTNVQSGAMKSFPGLKSFNVRFDHAQHVGAGRSSSQCATCHTPERRRVSLSLPVALGGHAACFQCHGPREVGRQGQDISSCSTCHRLAGYARTSEGSKAYSIGFSHANHGRSKKLNCNSCHSIRAGMAQRRQVTSPIPDMHSASGRAESCASCHDDKRAFGVAKSSDCQRCHQGTTFRM